MAALPSRPRVRYIGQERLAVDLAWETGELAALPADLEAPGTPLAMILHHSATSRRVPSRTSLHGDEVLQLHIAVLADSGPPSLP